MDRDSGRRRAIARLLRLPIHRRRVVGDPTLQDAQLRVQVTELNVRQAYLDLHEAVRDRDRLQAEANYTRAKRRR